MKDDYDFSESAPNPFAKKLKKSVTIRLDVQAIDYFKAEVSRTGVPYQNLINLYLCQCAQEQRKLSFS